MARNGSDRAGALIPGAVLLAAALVTGGAAVVGGSGSTRVVVEAHQAVRTVSSAVRTVSSAVRTVSSAVSTVSSAVRGQDGRGRTAAELKALLTRPGMRFTAYPTADSPTCTELARGQVQAYLKAHPCTGLRRVGLEVRDGPGAVGLISVSTVRMPDEAGARALKAVLDRGGSGNINELTRERGAFRGVRYTGRYHASVQDGTLVIVADGEPATPPLPAPALTLLVGDAAN